MTVSRATVARRASSSSRPIRLSPGASPRISFESPALLFKVLTGKRWKLLNALTGAGPLTIREAARRVARDVKVA